MPSLKTNEVFAPLGLHANVIGSALFGAALKSPSAIDDKNQFKMANLIEIKDLEEFGVSKKDIQLALSDLFHRGLTMPQGETPFMVNFNDVESIRVTGITVNYAFNKSNQPDLFEDKKAAEFDEGTQGHRIGFAVYRCKVAKGEIEEGEPIDYRVNIDRYTIHPDHRAEENPQTFSTVRSLIVDSPVPSAEAGWKYWEEFKAKRTECDDESVHLADSLMIDEVRHGLDFDIKGIDGKYLAEILKVTGTTPESWVLVSEFCDLDTEDACFEAWETALDDLCPGTALASPALTVESGGATTEEKGDAVFAYDLKIDETVISVGVYFTNEAHLYEAVWYSVTNEKKQARVVEQNIAKTEKSSKTIATKWLKGVLS